MEPVTSTDPKTEVKRLQRDLKQELDAIKAKLNLMLDELARQKMSKKKGVVDPNVITLSDDEDEEKNLKSVPEPAKNNEEKEDVPKSTEIEENEDIIQVMENDVLEQRPETSNSVILLDDDDVLIEQDHQNLSNETPELTHSIIHLPELSFEDLKNLTDSSITTNPETPVLKRGRGRPPKNSKISSNVQEVPRRPETPSPPEKRGRGRPRKTAKSLDSAQETFGSLTTQRPSRRQETSCPTTIKRRIKQCTTPKELNAFFKAVAASITPPKNVTRQELVSFQFDPEKNDPSWPPNGKTAKCRTCKTKQLIATAGRCKKCANRYYYIRRFVLKTC